QELLPTARDARAETSEQGADSEVELVDENELARVVRARSVVIAPVDHLPSTLDELRREEERGLGQARLVDAEERSVGEVVVEVRRIGHAPAQDELLAQADEIALEDGANDPFPDPADLDGEGFDPPEIEEGDLVLHEEQVPRMGIGVVEAVLE